MAITLAKALEARKAELQGESVSDDEDKSRHPIRVNLLKRLEIELPEELEECVMVEKYPDGYHINLNLPGPNCIIFLQYGGDQTKSLERGIPITSLTLRCGPAVEEDKRLIRHCFSKWLNFTLPQDAKIRVKETDYSGAYHLYLEFSNVGIVSLRRTLYVYKGHVCAWPFSADSLWRAERLGGELSASECFDNLLDAVLFTEAYR